MNLNGVLVLLIKTDNLLTFQDKFKGHTVIVNFNDFIESQCRYNILSTPFNVDRELFASSRKFLHSVVEDTPICYMQTMQEKTSQLYKFFLEKIEYLNLLMASHGDNGIWFRATIPLCLVEYIKQQKFTTTKHPVLPTPVNNFINVCDGYSKIVDYLRSNPQALDYVFSKVIKRSGNRSFCIDFRKVLTKFNEGEPFILKSLANLFCVFQNIGVYFI